MRNNSERLSMEDRVTVVNKFAQRMANSRYTKMQVRRVSVSGPEGMRQPRGEQRSMG